MILLHPTSVCYKEHKFSTLVNGFTSNEKYDNFSEIPAGYMIL